MAPKVLHEANSFLFIHNDLQQAALHLVTTIETRVKNDDRSGITYDCLACLTMLAFSFEADLNFLGLKKVDRWIDEGKERLSFYKKLNSVFDVLGINYSPKERPFRVIAQLKDFRDLVAHGKPNLDSIQEEKEMTQQEIDSFDHLKAKWTEYCTPQNVRISFDDKEAVWQMLFKASGIEPYDATTHADHSFSIVPEH